MEKKIPMLFKGMSSVVKKNKKQPQPTMSVPFPDDQRRKLNEEGPGDTSGKSTEPITSEPFSSTAPEHSEAKVASSPPPSVEVDIPPPEVGSQGGVAEVGRTAISKEKPPKWKWKIEGDTLEVKIPYAKSVMSVSSAESVQEIDTFNAFVVGVFEQLSPLYLRQDAVAHPLIVTLGKCARDLFKVGVSLSTALQKLESSSEGGMEKLAAENAALKENIAKLHEGKRLLDSLLETLSGQKLALERKVETLTAEKEALVVLERRKLLFSLPKTSSKDNLEAEKANNNANCRTFLRKFLGSSAFNAASSAYMGNVTKHIVYLAVSALARFYPFSPDYLGFTDAPMVGPDLSACSWDVAENVHLNECGVKLEIPKDLLPDLDNMVVAHPWSETGASWAEDIERPDEESGGEEADAEVHNEEGTAENVG